MELLDATEKIPSDTTGDIPGVPKNVYELYIITFRSWTEFR
jgi:hypothetical protein